MAWSTRRSGAAPATALRSLSMCRYPRRRRLRPRTAPPLELQLAMTQRLSPMAACVLPSTSPCASRMGQWSPPTAATSAVIPRSPCLRAWSTRRSGASCRLAAKPAAGLNHRLPSRRLQSTSRTLTPQAGPSYQFRGTRQPTTPSRHLLPLTSPVSCLCRRLWTSTATPARAALPQSTWSALKTAQWWPSTLSAPPAPLGWTASRTRGSGVMQRPTAPPPVAGRRKSATARTSGSPSATRTAISSPRIPVASAVNGRAKWNSPSEGSGAHTLWWQSLPAFARCPTSPTATPPAT
mmetsp:Transcript_3534/g.10178  ORF Transcript_3534/g.10178 Transcript_3534/m.10178 type:complete len:294 (-) Transcript_3534:1227-2108(-)